MLDFWELLELLIDMVDVGMFMCGKECSIKVINVDVEMLFIFKCILLLYELLVDILIMLFMLKCELMYCVLKGLVGN